MFEQNYRLHLVAAAEVHTGAMVALIPTAEDAERLAVEGGEPFWSTQEIAVAPELIRATVRSL